MVCMKTFFTKCVLIFYLTTHCLESLDETGLLIDKMLLALVVHSAIYSSVESPRCLFNSLSIAL